MYAYHESGKETIIGIKQVTQFNLLRALNDLKLTTEDPLVKNHLNGAWTVYEARKGGDNT